MNELTKFSCFISVYFVVTTLLILEWHKEKRICTWTAIFTFIAFALAGLTTKRMDIYSERWSFFLLAKPYGCIWVESGWR
jgi:hypothetical protein